MSCTTKYSKAYTVNHSSLKNVNMLNGIIKRLKDYLRNMGTFKKNDLTKTERSYKKTLDKSLRTYRINMKNKLKRLRTSNPKDYWNILNSNRHPNDNKNTIDINSLFDYFKQLNSNGDENREYKLEDILQNMDSTNDELNSPITGEEIKCCIIK